MDVNSVQLTPEQKLLVQQAQASLKMPGSGVVRVLTSIPGRTMAVKLIPKMGPGVTAGLPHKVAVVPTALSPTGQSAPAGLPPKAPVTPAVAIRPEPETKFQWTPKQALMLLASYEMQKGTPSHSKDDKKMWQDIANDLNAQKPSIFPPDTTVTYEQCKNKISNIKNSMSKKLDHNNQSGNEPKELNRLESRLQDILELSKDGRPIDAVTLQSPIIGGASQSTPRPSHSTSPLRDNPSASTQSPVITSHRFKKKKGARGTGSKVAASKIELEEKFYKHLDSQAKMGEAATNHQKELVELRKREVAAKEKKLTLMTRYLDLKERQLRERQKRFDKKMDLEDRKLTLKEDIVRKQEAGLL